MQSLRFLSLISILLLSISCLKKEESADSDSDTKKESKCSPDDKYELDCIATGTLTLDVSPDVEDDFDLTDVDYTDVIATADEEVCEGMKEPGEEETGTVDTVSRSGTSFDLEIDEYSGSMEVSSGSTLTNPSKRTVDLGEGQKVVYEYTGASFNAANDTVILNYEGKWYQKPYCVDSDK